MKSSCYWKQQAQPPGDKNYMISPQFLEFLQVPQSSQAIQRRLNKAHTQKNNKAKIMAYKI